MMSEELTEGRDGEDAPALARLVADLGTIHACPLPVPLHASIDRAVQAHLRAQTAGELGVVTKDTARHHPVPTRRVHHIRARRTSVRAWPAMLAAALVVLCLFLAAALIRQVPGSAPAAQPSATIAVPRTTAGYVSSLCGYRLTVVQAYADANRVIVGYRIAPPTGRTFLNGFTYTSVLRTAQGTALRQGAAGGTPTALGDAGDRFTTLGQASGTLQSDVFETTGQDQGGRSATFMFSISALHTTEFVGGASATWPCERYGATGAGIRTVSIPGTFTVRFTLPVVAARQATLHWVIGSGPNREVVDRIVVTPTETRIYVSGSGIYRPQIEINATRPYHGPNGGWNMGSEHVIVYDNYATDFHSLYRKPNPWTLAVLRGSTPGSEGNGPPFASLRVELS